MEPNEARDFFISYNKADKDWAKWIGGVLTESGYTVYLQAWDIRPGDDFMMGKMNAFLEKSRGFIPVLSGNYIDSPYCEHELSVALNKHLKDKYRFIPVRVASRQPPELIQTIVYIDIFGIDEQKAETKLLQAVDPGPIPRKRPEFPGQARPTFPGSAASHSSPISNLPPRNQHFTGRVEKLKEIENEFRKESRLAVKGTGGFGKTELAVEYAYRHTDDFDVSWLANAQSAVTLETAYREFLLRAGVPEASLNDPAAVIRMVKAWLQEHSRYLFVFDNAEGMAKSLQGYLPEGPLQGQIIINTRDKLPLPYTQIDLDVFALEESIEFLTNRNSCTNDDARALATELGNLPLALGHAAAYMEQTQCGCAEYLELLQEGGLALLGEEIAEREPEKTVAVTWLVSINKIQSESAKQLFDICAYFAPEDIPLELLTQGRESLPEPLRGALGKKYLRNKLLLELKGYSLLSFRRDNAGRYLLSMHRLMQRVVRASHEDTLYVLSCLDLAYSVFEYKYGNKESMDAFERNVAHVLAIANHAAKKLEDDESQKKAARLYHRAGLGFDYSGKYTQALEWYSKALTIRENVLGKEHPETAITYNNIAEVYREQGDYPEALEWYEKALTIEEKVLDKEHPSTATTYNNIAFVYSGQGEYSKALEWFFKALDIVEKKLGSEHSYTASTYNNIAGVYDDQGDYPKALEWYEKALAIKEKVLGKEHPDTATTYNNIAIVYRKQGDYLKALEWYKKSHPILRNMLGENHPYTKSSIKNMKSAYNAAGFEEPFEAWCEREFGATAATASPTPPA